jgi:hypothetical protein
MSKVLALMLSVLVLVVLSGCATPWQNKATASYTTATQLVTVAEQTAQPSCVANQLPVARCVQLKTIYANIYSSCGVAAKTLKLSFFITDKAQLQSTLLNFQTKLAEIQTLVNDYINLYQQVVKESKTKPAALRGAISPELLSVLIQAFISLMGQMPGLLNSLNTWNQSAVDIPALIIQIDNATNSLPIWN